MKKIIYVYQRQVCGVHEAELTLDGVTIITGKNATNKTSHADGLIAALGGGVEGELLMKGKSEGEIVVVFDDDTRITATVTPKGVEHRVFDPSRGKELSKDDSKRFVKSLSDMTKVNPIRFMKANDKEKIKMLLDTFPFQLKDEQLERIGIVREEISRYTTSPSHIDLLDILEKKFYDERTGVNRLVDEAKISFDAISVVTLDDDPDEVRQQINDLEQTEQTIRYQRMSELTKLDQDAEAEKKRLEQVAATWRTSIEARTKADSEAMQKTYEERLAELNKWRDEQKASINATEKAELERVNATLKEDLDRDTATLQANTAAVQNKYSDELVTIAGQLEGLRARRDNIDRYEEQRKKRAEAEARYTKHKAESERLTEKVTTIRTVRVELLESVPIPGLAIKENKVYVNDLPFNALNRAQQMRFSVDYSCHINGPVVVLDEGERLDSDNLNDMCDYVAERGIQIIVTRVTDEPGLHITTRPGRLPVNGQEVPA